MSHYVKLFGSILDSTVWQEPSDVRIVWITMLAMADQHGEVEASIPGLARRAGVTVEVCERAIATFLSPDRYSRTRDFDGRRIEEMDGGWRLLNHDKYRSRLAESDTKQRAAERQRRKRERDSHAPSRPVTPCHAPSQEVTPVTTSDQIRSEADQVSPSEGVAEAPPATAQGTFTLEAPGADDPGAAAQREMAEAVTHYQRRWVEVFHPADGLPPKLSQGDRGQLRQMLKAHGLATWKEYLERYLADPDQKLATDGYALAFMTRRLNGYRVNAKPQRAGNIAPAAHVERGYDATEEFGT